MQKKKKKKKERSHMKKEWHVSDPNDNKVEVLERLDNRIASELCVIVPNNGPNQSSGTDSINCYLPFQLARDQKGHYRKDVTQGPTEEACLNYSIDKDKCCVQHERRYSTT
ncbi:hypothetical protein CEXT_641251 [Caerostris extrusa]|uniref:Uncharacterized protein n=1 Tax=Caerostris extrusa TaxID=172846 RepID=A0AAV4SKA1_CAEEX|nr:hypothetical protein CEXT_641251 [Caerostris extrusa]